MWSQTPPLEPVINITNEGPAWWVIVLGSALPAIAALLVVAISGWAQRRAQERSFEDADRRWQDQQRVERERWEIERAAEHERFLRPERLRTYAELLAAIDEQMEAGIGAAEWITSPERDDRSLERLNELLTGLGETLGGPPGHGPPEVERWRSSRRAMRRAGLQAALLASDEHRRNVVEALQSNLPSPLETPTAWLWREGVPESAPGLDELAQLRNRVEQVARREILELSD